MKVSARNRKKLRTAVRILSVASNFFQLALAAWPLAREWLTT